MFESSIFQVYDRKNEKEICCQGLPNEHMNMTCTSSCWLIKFLKEIGSFTNLLFMHFTEVTHKKNT